MRHRVEGGSLGDAQRTEVLLWLDLETGGGIVTLGKTIKQSAAAWVQALVSEKDQSCLLELWGTEIWMIFQRM